MAKYADYVGKQGNVDKELDEVKGQAPTRQRNIPESVSRRFDGKSLEDVLESYAELQQLNSRQGEDLGKLRKTVDQLLELQSQIVTPQAQKPATEPDTGITVDDLYANPNDAVERAAKRATKETADRVNQLEQRLVQRERELGMQDLERKYNGWMNEIQTPEFLNWVAASPVRARLVQQANGYDFAAANDILELWYEKKGSAQVTQSNLERERQFRDATLETSSPGTLDVADTYSRADLQEKRIAAKLGNRQAQRWLDAHKGSINAAYAEGRITD